MKEKKHIRFHSISIKCDLILIDEISVCLYNNIYIGLSLFFVDRAHFEFIDFIYIVCNQQKLILCFDILSSILSIMHVPYLVRVLHHMFIPGTSMSHALVFHVCNS